MIDHTEPPQTVQNQRLPVSATESGELERPILRRKIDCGMTAATPLDRRIAARGGRRRDDTRL